MDDKQCKTWITSDWHLGDERFEILQRPFIDKLDMIDTLVNNFNALVDPNDEVIVVGDISYELKPEFLHLVSLFNGNKTLVRGNHDRPLSDKMLQQYFTNVIPEGDGYEIEVDGIHCYITHYPTRGVKDRFNLVGHVHTVWKYQLNMLNIGVDVNHFKPVDVSTISWHYKAICEYYDKDAWSAYSDINTQFIGKRGKEGSYYQGEE